jgi:hypothetical protein
MMSGGSLRKRKRITQVLRLETCRLKERTILVMEKRRRSKKWKRMKQVKWCQNVKCKQDLGRW